MGSCPSCGAEVERSWKHCRTCGASLRSDEEATGTESRSVIALASNADLTAEAVGPPPETEGSEAAVPEPPPSRERKVFVVGAVVVAVALLSTGVWYHLDVRTGLTRSLATTRSRLTSTSARLARSDADLATTRADLVKRTAERDAARSSAAQLQKVKQALQNRIKGLRGSLQNSRQQVELQAGQIEVLKTCLGGVSVALTDVLQEDYLGAADALTAVQDQCNSAFALFS
jgi:hypothetical protein